MECIAGIIMRNSNDDGDDDNDDNNDDGDNDSDDDENTILTFNICEHRQYIKLSTRIDLRIEQPTNDLHLASISKRSRRTNAYVFANTGYAGVYVFINIIYIIDDYSDKASFLNGIVSIDIVKLISLLFHGLFLAYHFKLIKRIDRILAPEFYRTKRSSVGDNRYWYMS